MSNKIFVQIVLIAFILQIHVFSFRIHHKQSNIYSTIANKVINHSRLQSTLDNQESIPKTTNKEAQAKATKGKSWLKCKPVGAGSMPGQNRFPNDDFKSLVDTNDAWIAKRTGIRSRHVIEKDGSLRELSINSAKQALQNSNINPLDIDLVIVATTTPDDLFGDAASIAFGIGATNAAGFDLTAACSGFVFGLITAGQFLNSGAYSKVLVVGSDALTRFLDWSDRGTCILFGDGSGAVVLEATENIDDSGILGFALHSDGSGYNNLQLPFVSKFEELNNEAKTIVDQGSYGKMKMNGAEVYKFAVNKVSEIF